MKEERLLCGDTGKSLSIRVMTIDKEEICLRTYISREYGSQSTISR